MKRWSLPFSLLLIALGAALYYQHLHAGSRAGFPAPDFNLKDLSGRVHRLSDFRGKVVFLNFWATWCPPCRMEMPSMERLHQRLRGKDFVLLAISEDETGRAAVQPFVGQLGISFPVLLDEEGRVPQHYGVTGYPETFIIDRGGRVVQHTIGPEDWDSEPVYRYLIQLLDSSAASTQATSEQRQAGS